MCVRYLDSFPFIPKEKGISDFDANYGKITGEASPTNIHGASVIVDRMKYIFIFECLKIL